LLEVRTTFMNEKSEKMKVKIAAPSLSKRELEIEVSADEVGQEFEKVLDDYASRVRLNGFRPGKAPKDMVKRLFYSDIKNSVVETLAPRALQENLRAENISPITTPIISEVSFQEGAPFRFKATVEVLPDFELPSYKKIRINKKEVKVEEEEIEHSLEELRQKSAEYLPVEGRGVADGDYVVLEWKGKNVKTKKFLPTEKVLILAGHPDNEKLLNENLLGLKPQEVRTFVISYPRDHAQKKLAGRTLECEIKVISIKEKRVPEMSDEWAKDLGEFENLSDLRAKVRKELEKAKNDSVRREMGDEIVRTISDQLKLELPESLVAEEAGALLRSWVQSAGDTLTPEQFEELRQKAKIQAQQKIKDSLILKKIADQETLGVTDEEIEEEVKVLAKRNNVPLAHAVESISREGKREDLRHRLLLQKAIDFLLENAVIY
jgi:trigger factor